MTEPEIQADPETEADRERQQLERTLEVFRRANDDLADAYEHLEAEHAALQASHRSEVERLTRELTAVRSRAGYRLVDAVHRSLRRVPGVYPLARWIVHRLAEHTPRP